MLQCERLCHTKAQLFLSLVATLMTTILNRYAQLHSQDVDCVQHYISQVFCPHSLTLADTRQSLNARLYLRQGQDVAYGRLRYGAQVQIQPQPLDDFYLLQIPLSGQEQIHTVHGRFASTSRLASIISPTQDFSMEHSLEADKLFVRIGRQGLERHYQEYFAQPVRGPLEFQPSIPLDAPGGASLRRLLDWQFAEVSDGTLFDQPRQVRQFEQTLIYALFELHQHNQPAHKTAAALPHVLRRALDFMESQTGQPITIGDIAQAAGVSVRSLYAGFREHLGVAPMARLKQMRLEAARRYLQEGGMSVTEVALACGFAHLGQFSADYRHRYGERPSETLSGLTRPRSSI